MGVKQQASTFMSMSLGKSEANEVFLHGEKVGTFKVYHDDFWLFSVFGIYQFLVEKNDLFTAEVMTLKRLSELISGDFKYEISETFVSYSLDNAEIMRYHSDARSIGVCLVVSGPLRVHCENLASQILFLPVTSKAIEGVCRKMVQSVHDWAHSGEVRV